MDQFNSQQHLRSAVFSSLYYLLVYIPLILPLQIWKQAAVGLAGIWESKSLEYHSVEKYGLAKFFYEKMILKFIFDAFIFLAWPYLLYELIVEQEFFSGLGSIFEYAGFMTGMKPLIGSLLGVYASVIVIRLSKEAFLWIIDNLLTWAISVIRAIGGFFVNAWKLNLVIRRKD